MGRSDGAASKSSILPSAVGEADLEAQRASNLAAYTPPLRIKYEGAPAPSCIPKEIIKVFDSLDRRAYHFARRFYVFGWHAALKHGIISKYF